MSAQEARHRWLVAAVFVTLGLLFVMGGRWGVRGNVDVIATTVPAWRLATEQTLEVELIEELNPWIVEDSEGRPVSNRTPGLIGTAYPAYLVTRPDGFTNAPGTVTAILMTLGALYVLYRLLLRDFEQRFSLAVIVVLALGTTTWTISASQLWPHGPGQFWMALAILGVATTNYWTTGWAFAAAIFTRPVTAVPAAVMGIGRGWVERDWRPVLEVGVPSLLGLAALLAYNTILFGEPSVGGAGSEPAATRALDTYGLVDYLDNVKEMFIGLPNGFLLFSPVIAMAGWGVVRSWLSIPKWAKSGLFAALAYLMIHAGLNRASGGMEIFYRYPLEPIVLAAPALAWGAHAIWNRRDLTRRLLLYSAVFSVSLQVLNAFVISCRSVSDFPSLCGLLA